jgi:membrane glycosyltransferase
VPRGTTLALVIGWIAMVYAAKWVAFAQVLLSLERRESYGGASVFAAGVVAETVFTLLLDAIQMPHKALALARLALGARAAWLPQNRRDRGVSWAEAALLFWPHTLFGVAVLALFAAGSCGAMLWALPFVIGLPLAIPFTVLTSDPRFGGWLRRHRIAAIPEEIGVCMKPFRAHEPAAELVDP